MEIEEQTSVTKKADDFENARQPDRKTKNRPSKGPLSRSSQYFSPAIFPVRSSRARPRAI